MTAPQSATRFIPVSRFIFSSPTIFALAMVVIYSPIHSCFAQDLAPTTNEAKATEVKKEEPKKAESKPEVKSEKVQIQVLPLSGSYVDFMAGASLNPTDLILGNGSIKMKSFYRLCDYLDELSKKPNVSIIALDLSDEALEMNPAQLSEFSRRLTKLKLSNKKLYAWIENASTVHVAIASVCDRVIMSDFGGIDMPSMSMQSLFFRDAMDLVGVKASIVRAGDFKGAVEPYVLPQMSEHLRKHYLDMLASMNDSIVSIIAKGRGLTVAAVRDLQRERILSSQAALSKGVVDQLANVGAMKSTIEKEIGKPVQWIDQPSKVKKEMSMFELMSKLMSDSSKSSSRIKDSTIAVLHLSGAIVDGKKAMPGSIVSGPTVKAIEELANEDKIKGCVIRINSPGGSASASESIRQALKKLVDKKPTVVSMGEMAASGGYWVSCLGTPIYAESGTLTGSIGVFSMKISFGTLFRRIGVHVEAITLDESAKFSSMDSHWSDEDEKKMEVAIDDIYSKFLKLVSESRNIPIDQLKSLAGGRVWSGAQAKQAGLVDEIGGLDDCLAVVAKKASLDDYKVIHRPNAPTGLDILELLGDGDDEEVSIRPKIDRLMSSASLDLVRSQGFNLTSMAAVLGDSLSNVNHYPRIWAIQPMEIRVR